MTSGGLYLSSSTSPLPFGSCSFICPLLSLPSPCISYGITLVFALPNSFQTSSKSQQELYSLWRSSWPDRLPAQKAKIIRVQIAPSVFLALPSSLRCCGQHQEIERWLNGIPSLSACLPSLSLLCSFFGQRPDVCITQTKFWNQHGNQTDDCGEDDIFSFISGLARDLLGFANQGTAFLTSAAIPKLGWFLVGVLPAIIFFVALVQLLFYWGVLQWFIGKFAVFFFWSMRVSGAEAVVAAASPFIGQGESAMLIKPFVAHLTQAELHQIMCSGFATIAGSVLVAYISLGVNPQALISSCVMSIPASLAISKLRYPETEETLTAGRVVVPDDDEHRAANSLHAFANGAWLGLKIAGMITATLLCIIALLGLANGLLTWWGHYLNINNPPLTVELIVGYICYPIAFLLGVPRNGDLLKVSQLIGTKLIAVSVLYKAPLHRIPRNSVLRMSSSPTPPFKQTPHTPTSLHVLGL